MERRHGGLLVSFKAFDNKEQFFFSVETKTSLAEAGSCPLDLILSLLLPPPSVSLGMFVFFCCFVFVFPRLSFFSHLGVLSLSPFRSSPFSPVSYSYFCLPPWLFSLPSLRLSLSLPVSSPAPPNKIHWSCWSVELPHRTFPREQEETQIALSRIPRGTEVMGGCRMPSPLLNTSPRDWAMGAAAGLSVPSAFAHLLLFLADEILSLTLCSFPGRLRFVLCCLQRGLLGRVLQHE